ncbi:NEW3 domain-containing protein [Paenibacillus thermotolerans]|uniref:COG1470 family protein n=1 Tax=Paenibacillus thermotolerans TaxID=3027807 RepID=UPI00236895B5|nr:MULTISPECIES: NEW3 domain-containing protein [unclassified Paenibacillus]
MSSTWKKTVCIMLILLLGTASLAWTPASAAGEITLFTPYKHISVPPGETINYSIDMLNNTGQMQSAPIRVSGLPADWEYKITAGSWEVKELSVKGGETQSLQIEVDVPLQVQKGEYRFTVEAGSLASLPLTVNVSETGTYKSELTVDQPNMEGNADSNFNYRLDLRNRTGEKQLYALTSEAERGWDVVFKVGGTQATSASVEPNSTQSVNVDITPPEGITEGTYTIPIKANAGSTSAETELEVVITGKYAMQLTTPKGLLSADVNAGGKTKVELEVRNTGTTALKDVALDYTAPIGWEVTFDKKTIDSIEPGQTGKVTATLKASDKAIPGDYVTSITARTPEVSSSADFRIAVKTSILWGWLGILIIVCVFGGIYYLFRKYGRR